MPASFHSPFFGNTGEKNSIFGRKKIHFTIYYFSNLVREKSGNGIKEIRIQGERKCLERLDWDRKALRLIVRKQDFVIVNYSEVVKVACWGEVIEKDQLDWMRRLSLYLCEASFVRISRGIWKTLTVPSFWSVFILSDFNAFGAITKEGLTGQILSNRKEAAAIKPAIELWLRWMFMKFHRNCKARLGIIEFRYFRAHLYQHIA